MTDSEFERRRQQNVAEIARINREIREIEKRIENHAEVMVENIKKKYRQRRRAWFHM